ncbi:electron transfer flavoprotein subunit alpha/FixB family protein [Pseudomonas sp. CR3202]|uniref:electron transfer flavoprotein subunit alpha/FixB family protein n=1 Tax=Pseudomonas sp. CR3202 TaxID=3351532 RepID=UPI003BF1B0DE
MTVLIIAEHDNRALKPSTLNAMEAASKLGGRVDVLVAGLECGAVAEQVARVKGVGLVKLADAAPYGAQLAENVAPLVVELARAEGYEHVFAPATAAGKNLLPRVAALLDVAQISDVIEVVSTDAFVRPIYAGNALVTVQSQDAVKVISVRTTAFAAAGQGADAAPIERLHSVSDKGLSSLLSSELKVSERVDLTTAKIVISGGRGMGSGDNFALLEKVADNLGAAVGASRAAVDAGFVANDMQVGQTGKIVAPELYIAVGISGAIQHLAGMKDSKIIVAINKDEEAPIFRVADYGLVADLFEALPVLEAELS